MPVFSSRRDAGRVLAQHLATYAGRTDVIVLALPRGGVPVAYEVAMALRAPLDVLMVRKIGAPDHEEFAVGAVASGGTLVVDRDAMDSLALTEGDIRPTIARERETLERRERLYREGRPFPDVAGKTVILVDDGLATGSTMRAAVRAMKQQNPAAIVVAVPVASADVCEAMAREAGDCVCAVKPAHLYAVGVWYHDFSQTRDDEVRTLLERAAAQLAEQPRAGVNG